MDERKEKYAARACFVGIVNQAIIVNVTALLFVPFMRLYAFTYVQLGLLTAVGFGAQICADVALLFLIDHVSRRKLAAVAATMSAAGLVFYGCVPYIFTNGAIYGGIVAATVVFAFAGGMLEVVLSNVADTLEESRGGVSICLLRTVYAWAQVGLAAVLFGFIALLGAERWNIAMFLFALVPAAALLFLSKARFPVREKTAPVRASFRPFYLFAVLAVFFGYGTEVVMNQWISAFAAQSFGFESAGIFGCAAFAACLGLGGILYVLFERRRKNLPIYLLCISALAAAATYVLAALVPQNIPALCFAVFCGVFAGMLSPGAMTAASDFLPQTGGWMLASLAVAQDIGAAILPSVAGAVADGASMRLSFLILSLVPLLAALFLFMMSKSRGGGDARKKEFPLRK